jgi:Lrp/AsnC family transcriptional regulator for asnA, asnC and gidA
MLKNIDDFDSLDRKLLWLLDQDSTLSYSQLARKVRRGSDTVRYRVLRFFESGIVRSTLPVINPATLGLTTFKTYVRFRSKPARIADFLKVLSEHSRLYWLAEWYGRWDVLFSLAATTPFEFYEMQQGILGAYADIIEEVDLAINSRVHRFPKNYLLGGSAEGTIQCSSEAVADLDGVDKAILKEMARDVRSTDAELATAVGTTAAVVRYRIENLISKGVIVSFRLQFDYNRAGMLLFKLFITPDTPDSNLRRRLFNFCKKTAAVTCFVEQLGRMPFEMEVELPNYEAFHTFIDSLRYSFDGSLRSIEHALLRRDHFHRVPVL